MIFVNFTPARNACERTCLYSHGDKPKETTCTHATAADFFRRLMNLHNSPDYPLSRAAVFLTSVYSPTSVSQNRFPDKGPPAYSAPRSRWKDRPAKIYTQRADFLFRKRAIAIWGFGSSGEKFYFFIYSLFTRCLTRWRKHSEIEKFYCNDNNEIMSWINNGCLN